MKAAQLPLAAALLWAAVMVLAPGGAQAAAAGGPRALNCPPSIIETVVSCSGSGSVLADSNETFAFAVEPDGEGRFDLVIALSTDAGDADLLVSTPDGGELASKHGSGADIVFIARNKVDAGTYLITVVGASEHSHYRLTVEQHEKRRALAPGERAALQEVLEGPCCARAGSCASLRTGLNGFESIGSDLCNTGLNVCDVEGHLLHLALVNEYMACPFPAAFGQLTKLEMLQLTTNDFTGGLDGEVAAVVKQLPALQSLVLSHNRLGGSLSCDLLASGRLAVLDVTANQIEGTIPACLVEAPTMQELALSNNRLQGTLPAPPAGSPLRLLAAHSMGLTGAVPDLSQLPALEVVLLQNNQLAGGLPGLPPSVRIVNAEYNKLSGPIPDQWGAGDAWEVLRLRHNRLSGPLPAGLARQEGLEILLLDHNALTGVLPTYWDAPRLQRLAVQHNSLSGPLPASLGALPSLYVLQAGHNQLGGTGSLEAFARAAVGGAALQYLDLENNLLDGEVPPELAQLPVFRGGFLMVDGATTPTRLDLSDNHLSGPFPTWVAEAMVRNSAAVDLRGNSLACPAQLPVSRPLPEYRFIGMDCLAPDGTRQSVVPLVQVQPQGGDAPAAPAEGGEDEGGSAPAAGSGESSSGGSSGGGLPGWAIALIVVGSVAAAGALALLAWPCVRSRWQDWRAARYQTYRDESPGADPGAALSKKAAVAELAELGASKALPGGAKAAPPSAAAGSPGASAGEAPFRIGTRVHSDLV